MEECEEICRLWCSSYKHALVADEQSSNWIYHQMLHQWCRVDPFSHRLLLLLESEESIHYEHCDADFYNHFVIHDAKHKSNWVDTLASDQSSFWGRFATIFDCWCFRGHSYYGLDYLPGHLVLLGCGRLGALGIDKLQLHAKEYCWGIVRVFRNRAILVLHYCLRSRNFHGNVSSHDGFNVDTF